MKPRLFLFILSLLLLGNTGCWDQKIIEKKTFIVELGMESAPDQTVLFSMAAPRFINLQDGQEYNQLFSTRANLIHEGIKGGDLIAEGDIETGKIKHVMFSEELSRQGIQRLLEGFERNPLWPLQCSLVVVEGSPNELLKKMILFKNRPPKGYNLEQLLRQNASYSYILKNSLGDFEVAYFTPGIDPLLPMVKVVKDEIAVIGTALFANDRMVGKLDTQQTAFLLAMMNNLPKTILFFKSSRWFIKGEPLKKGIAVSVMKTRRKLLIRTPKKRQPEIKLELRMKGNLLEYHLDNLDDQKKVTEIEKQIATEIKASCLQVIQYTQRVGSDPIGFGNQIRAKQNSYWKTIHWMETYRNAKITINVQFKLVDYGLTK